MEINETMVTKQGGLLVKKQLISTEQLQIALREQKAWGGSLSAVLAKLRLQ